jgi:hypothetical protein
VNKQGTEHQMISEYEEGNDHDPNDDATWWRLPGGTE